MVGGLFFGAHEYLFLPSPMPKPDLVVVDEDVAMKAADVLELSVSALTDFGNAMNLLHIADYRAVADAARDALTKSPKRELETLRDRGLDRTALEAAANYVCRAVGGIVGVETSPASSDEVIEAMLRNAEPSSAVWRQVAILFRQLALEIEVARPMSTSVVFEPKTQKLIVSYLKPQSKKIDDRTPIIALDGTGDIELCRRIFGAHMTEEKTTVSRDASVTQVTGRSFSRQSSTGVQANSHPHRPQAAERLRQEISAVVCREYVPGKTLVVCSKRAIRPLASVCPPEVHFAHFGALRGLNSFEDCEVVFVVGREQPACKKVEAIARAFFATELEPITTAQIYRREPLEFRLKEGISTWVENVEAHPDPRVQRVLAQIREAEIVQAADRIRPIFNSGRRIFLLNAVPTSVQPDRVLDWSDFVAGGTVWDRISAKLDGVLPLRPDWLRSTYPTIFTSLRTAEREVANLIAEWRTQSGEWKLGKKRHFSNGSLFWGLAEFFEFRLAGQRGADSLVLVKYGSSDARARLAKLMGRGVIKFDRVAERPAHNRAARVGGEASGKIGSVAQSSRTSAPKKRRRANVAIPSTSGLAWRQLLRADGAGSIARPSGGGQFYCAVVNVNGRAVTYTRTGARIGF